MPEITERAAGRYAASVWDVLVDAGLAAKSLKPAVINGVAQQATCPDRRFELIVTHTRSWRLHPADGRDRDEWRVRIGCHMDRWTEADIRFSDSVNARLRAIKLED